MKMMPTMNVNHVTKPVKNVPVQMNTNVTNVTQKLSYKTDTVNQPVHLTNTEILTNGNVNHVMVLVMNAML
jgi:hypothetical protein